MKDAYSCDLDDAGLDVSYRQQYGAYERIFKRLGLDGNPLPSWLSFSAATRTFSGTPSSGDAGTITAKVIATDSQGASAFDSFDLAISAGTGASAPVNTVPGVQAINEDASRVFSVANGNAISVADSDSASLAVRVSVDAGALTLGSTPGTLAITGDGTGTITLAGATLDINTALDGLTYAPVVNGNGPVTLTVQTGYGGTPATGLTDTDNVTINITPVNDAPVAKSRRRADLHRGHRRWSDGHLCRRRQRERHRDADPLGRGGGHAFYR